MNTVKKMTFTSSEMYGTRKCTPEANAEKIVLNGCYTYRLTTAFQAIKSDTWLISYCCVIFIIATVVSEVRRKDQRSGQMGLTLRH
jgi:hypothetical protein